MQRTEAVPTMANDGTILLYNEEYVTGLTDQQLLAVMAHEVMHCALGHMFRYGSRNFRKWNEATDIVINKIIRDAGFQLPYTFLEPEEATYAGMPSEQVYALRDKEDGQGKDGDGHEHGNCDCGLRPAGSNSKESDYTGDIMSSTDWQVLTEQAAQMAKRAGKLPASLDRLVSATHESRTDWRTILRRFIENTVPHDYSWAKPNRRFISQGLYLPGMSKENSPRIGIAIDTSGSIDAQLLSQFASELTSIIHEVRPESLDVVYCDAAVQHRESFSPDDAEVVLHAKGGGGTAFEPALAEFDKDPPACVVYLTDLYGPAPKEREYPVLWAVPETGAAELTWWGEYVKLSKYD